MKTNSLTIEAQQICKEAATRVFEEVKLTFLKLEKDNRFIEEPTISIESYSGGYQIRIEASLDYLNKENHKLPGYFNNPYIYPGTFFESYMKGAGAHLEYGLIVENPKTKRITGTVTIITMGQFKNYADSWVKGVKEQLNLITF